MVQSSEYIEEILRLVANNDGKWSWYQLDRALSTRGMLSKTPITSVLRQAENEGFLKSSPGSNPSQPCYRITEIGRARILKAQPTNGNSTGSVAAGHEELQETD